MPGRKLPASLTTILAGARDLEAAARGTHRERAAIAATSTMLLAAHEAGRQQLELARHLGMPLQTVHKRIQVARVAHPAGTGVVVDAPLDRAPAPPAVLQRPVAERDRLTVTEAAGYIERNSETVRNWLAHGVLPNTDRRVANRHLCAGIRNSTARELAGVSDRQYREARRGPEVGVAGDHRPSVVARAFADPQCDLAGRGCHRRLG